MKMKTRKIIVLLSIASALNIWMTGCGTTHEYNTKIQENEILPEKASDAEPEDNEEDIAKAQENAVGRWQVLDPETAAANAPIPDSCLIQVAFDDDTTFLVRTIYDNGESYEDEEAGFEDLQEHMAVDMKGHFEEDVFYATEIRLPEIGNIGDAGKEAKADEEDTKADPIIGIVEKYEDNIIVIKDYGDGMSYYFSTKEAQIIEENSSIAVGDKVEITYQGLLGDEKNPGDCSKVCKME